MEKAALGRIREQITQNQGIAEQLALGKKEPGKLSVAAAFAPRRFLHQNSNSGQDNLTWGSGTPRVGER